MARFLPARDFFFTKSYAKSIFVQYTYRNDEGRSCRR
jgi:hypothetical protein